MAGIFENRRDKSSRQLGSKGLIIKGLPYRNTASRFWSSLWDEVLEDFVDSDGLVLSALSGGELEPDLLSPEIALQESLETLENEDLDEIFHDTLMELELLGPPATVKATFVRGEEEIESRELPLDCVDAELFPFLLVWLLEWAEISEFAWNNERVFGDFCAEDPRRHLVYKVQFCIENTHISEGLFERKMTMRFTREAAVRRIRRIRAVGDTPLSN